ncbi:hypothetical protein GCM10025880_26290 [Methylorubrum aminovorans]|nr:hypothetical protein GCM10025880_26290 [Methylorubrum aminovorans]
MKLAQLAADLPAVRELDINPLLADADGAVALDARVRIAPEPPPRSAAAATGIRGSRSAPIRPTGSDG